MLSIHEVAFGSVPTRKFSGKYNTQRDDLAEARTNKTERNKLSILNLQNYLLSRGKIKIKLANG